MIQAARRHCVVPAAPGFAQERILHSLATYHYVTATQLTRLLYAPGSRTRVQMLVKQLRDTGYVQAIFLPRRSQAGSSPSVYTLSHKGRGYLRRLGIPVSQRVRPSEVQAHSYLFLQHNLAVADVMIAASLLPRFDSRLSVAALQHDLDLKRRPVFVTTGQGDRVGVVPDAWLDLRLGEWQHCVCLELDRGTEEKQAWKHKVQGLLAFASGPYQAAFDTDSLTVAVLTTSGQKRLDDLVAWTEEELAAAYAQNLASYFCFAAADPATTSPQALFLAPLWRVPFRTPLQPLIDTRI